MCKPNEEMISKETFRELIRKIFSLCSEQDLWELFGDEIPAEEILDYAVDYYTDNLYPEIFEHFEYKPYMSGHDECVECLAHTACVKVILAFFCLVYQIFVGKLYKL